MKHRITVESETNTCLGIHEKSHVHHVGIDNGQVIITIKTGTVMGPTHSIVIPAADAMNLADAAWHQAVQNLGVK